FQLESSVEDWTGKDHGDEPFFYYRYKCRLLKNGRSIGEGVGSSNSWESKYRYRWVQESALPAEWSQEQVDALVKRGGTIFEFDFAIDKAETTGRYGKPADYWQRFKNAIADGTARSEKRDTKNGQRPGKVIDSTLYRVPNPDVCDQVNTLQKMAQKRAQIAAVLVGVNASEYFTQDLEDTHSETPEQVAERRIAEEQSKIDAAKQTAQSPQPGAAETGPHAARATASGHKAGNGHSSPCPVPSSSPEIPAAVQGIWARMSSIKGVCTELESLKKSLVEVCGQEGGEGIYYRILEKSGVEHANQFKS